MENLVNRGFELAIFGMGTVFIFLALLIIATHGMSLLVQKYEQEPPRTSVKAVTQKVDRHLFNVISAAIGKHRDERN